MASVEAETAALAYILGARGVPDDPRFGLPLKQWIDIASKAIVMVQSLPPHLYDEAWAHLVVDRRRRLKMGGAGVRSPLFVGEKPAALVSEATLRLCLEHLLVDRGQGEVSPEAFEAATELEAALNEL